jgi:hypothetical protein
MCNTRNVPGASLAEAGADLKQTSRVGRHDHFGTGLQNVFHFPSLERSAMAGSVRL